MRGIGLEGRQLAIGRRLANDGDRQDQGGQTVLRRQVRARLARRRQDAKGQKGRGAGLQH